MNYAKIQKKIIERVDKIDKIAPFVSFVEYPNYVWWVDGGFAIKIPKNHLFIDVKKINNLKNKLIDDNVFINLLKEIESEDLETVYPFNGKYKTYGKTKLIKFEQKNNDDIYIFKKFVKLFNPKYGVTFKVKKTQRGNQYRIICAFQGKELVGLQTECLNMVESW